MPNCDTLGIVAVHDVGTQDGQIFVVSEYLAGQDLAHWLKRTKPSWQHAVRLVIAVADAPWLMRIPSSWFIAT